MIPGVENITHSLLGATLAELTLPETASRSQRRVFFTVGIVASNLPDADLLYTSITAEPLGYLLHHRGHTHTLVGLAGQALLIVAVYMLPAISRHVGELRPRLWALIAASLLSHLTLDSWNSYGVHPFWPLSNRWYYGDTIFIVELLFWTILGGALWMNSRARRSVSASRWSAQRRSGAALAGMALFVVLMSGAKQVARARAIAATQPGTGEIMDVILSPLPANPLCWSALAVVKHEAAAEYAMTRGTVSILPRWANANGCGGASGADVAWQPPVRQSLTRLRELARDDCWVRAWLQFGRAPMLADGEISDLRYGGTRRANFSSMRLPPRGSSCPVNLTRWAMPRADLLH